MRHNFADRRIPFDFKYLRFTFCYPLIWFPKNFAVGTQRAEQQVSNI